MRALLIRRGAVFAGCAILLQGCALFSGKPALPKHGAIERAPQPLATADYDPLIENADIIYFPVERVGFGGKSEPPALLIAALERSGRPFAIGWDLIDGREQATLDALPAQNSREQERAIALLELSGNPRAREYCRQVLRNAHNTRLTCLALRYPVEGAAHRRREFAAEKIARYLRGAGSEARALIFLQQIDVDDEGSVPAQVAERIDVRQLVFGPEREAARLFTAR